MLQRSRIKYRIFIKTRVWKRLAIRVLIGTHLAVIVNCHWVLFVCVVRVRVGRRRRLGWIVQKVLGNVDWVALHLPPLASEVKKHQCNSNNDENKRHASCCTNSSTACRLVQSIPARDVSALEIADSVWILCRVWRECEGRRELAGRRERGSSFLDN